ncbi:hypothetical protein AALP_AA7G117100 [Arabis alpina]|uniref:Uncharacterized protein n=1 Tax=Arabis alpina TaxID=50452 RepID=A0A087GHG1_ARAAL|nr:hypothetical protein AALP_AA7G117100 [Arabis alpina]
MGVCAGTVEFDCGVYPSYVNAYLYGLMLLPSSDSNRSSRLSTILYVKGFPSPIVFDAISRSWYLINPFLFMDKHGCVVPMMFFALTMCPWLIDCAAIFTLGFAIRWLPSIVMFVLFTVDVSVWELFQVREPIVVDVQLFRIMIN